MRRTFLVIPLFLVLIGMLVAQEQNYVRVTAQNANLRGSPSATGKILDVVVKGQIFRLVEKRGEWALIETNKYVGWVPTKSITDSGALGVRAISAPQADSWKLISAYKDSSGMLVGIYMDESNFVRKGDSVDFTEKHVPIPRNQDQLADYLNLSSLPAPYTTFRHRLVVQNADCIGRRLLLRTITYVWNDTSNNTTTDFARVASYVGGEAGSIRAKQIALACGFQSIVDLSVEPQPTGKALPTTVAKPSPVIIPPSVQTIRPSSGTVMATGSYRTGLGDLTISNGTNTDAIAKLIDIRADASYREVYIRANSSTTIQNIAVGDYELIFSLGQDFAPSLNKFLLNASYSKFDSQLSFEETKERIGNTIRTNYDTYTLTLNTVAGGNAATSRISEAEFTKY